MTALWSTGKRQKLQQMVWLLPSHGKTNTSVFIVVCRFKNWCLPWGLDGYLWILWCNSKIHEHVFIRLSTEVPFLGFARFHSPTLWCGCSAREQGPDGCKTLELFEKAGQDYWMLGGRKHRSCAVKLQDCARAVMLLTWVLASGEPTRGRQVRKRTGEVGFPVLLLIYYNLVHLRLPPTA